MGYYNKGKSRSRREVSVNGLVTGSVFVAFAVRFQELKYLILRLAFCSISHLRVMNGLVQSKATCCNALRTKLATSIFFLLSFF